jgi:hypothetical protein
MRRSPDWAVCISARQSLTAPAVCLSSDNVKNDIMAWRVTPICSSSLLVVHKHHSQSARLRSLCRIRDAIWCPAQDRTFSVCYFFLRSIRAND